VTGCLTQEDPIGLAGGLNLYGFANGDPVNFSDPFGLCPPCVSEGGLAIVTRAALRATQWRPTPGQSPSPFLNALVQQLQDPEFTEEGYFFSITGLGFAASFAVPFGRAAALNVGSQGKHVVGHNNFIAGRSVLTHSDPSALVSRFSGTGARVRGTAGEAGYVERVNFGQVIGQYVNPATGGQLETSVGLIHYGRRGAHIVPARPEP
jgi:hypothetical protein